MQVRTAEIVAALSLATDLAMRAPFEHGLRSTCYAMRLADALGLDEVDRRRVYYVTALLYVGCTADLDVVIGAFGDEEVFRTRVAPVAYDLPGRMARIMVSMAGYPATGPQRAFSAVRTLARLPREMPRMMHAHCEVAGLHATHLHLPSSVTEVFGASYERWDGKGGPTKLRGQDVPIAARIAHVARDLDLQRSIGSREQADEVLRSRSGHAFDPVVVAAALELDQLDPAQSTWTAMLDAEPPPLGELRDDEIDSALATLGIFAELISPYFRGHAAAVSALAAEAATRIGLSIEEVDLVRRAGLVHDVGRVTVPVHVWERSGSLGPDEWERVRLHAYHSGRVLANASWLRDIGVVAALHHERCDGSGYHQGSHGAQQPLPARVLAAADTYCAMVESRPYRDALTPAAAAERLRGDADDGYLDSRAVAEVLAVAAGRTARPTAGGDLTPREIEVVRLLAHGAANKQIARALGISAKTVDNHLQRIYAKAGVSTRSAAIVWGMQRGVVVSPAPV